MAVLASYSYESFIGRTWALVVISIALFGICVSLWMMVRMMTMMMTMKMMKMMRMMMMMVFV